MYTSFNPSSSLRIQHIADIYLLLVATLCSAVISFYHTAEITAVFDPEVDSNFDIVTNNLIGYGFSTNFFVIVSLNLNNTRCQHYGNPS